MLYCFLFQWLHYDGNLSADVLLLHRHIDRSAQTYPCRCHRDRSCEIVELRSLQREQSCGVHIGRAALCRVTVKVMKAAIRIRAVS